MTPPIVKATCNVLAAWFPVNYDDYIQSDGWRRKAEAAKDRAGRRCQVCGRPEGVVHLEAHHNNYTRLGYEIDEDLIALCREDCHPAATQIRRRVYAGYKRALRGELGYKGR